VQSGREWPNIATRRTRVTAGRCSIALDGGGHPDGEDGSGPEAPRELHREDAGADQVRYFRVV
jgi:hypothetical protein